MSENIKTYPPSELCAACGGKCCQRMGCSYSPQDFKDLSYDGLKREIEKGRISIDWWEGETKEFYLRARHVDAPIVDASWGGVCINLTETGCSLSWEERPLAGRALKPGRDKCVGEYGKEESKNEWKPYSETLKKLVENFGGIPERDPIHELLMGMGAMFGLL